MPAIAIFSQVVQLHKTDRVADLRFNPDHRAFPSSYCAACSDLCKNITRELSDALQGRQPKKIREILFYMSV
jgi:hypothetical protein